MPAGIWRAKLSDKGRKVPCPWQSIPSIAIFVDGIAALAPGQTRSLSQTAIRALVGATLACLMTAAVAGIFYGKRSLLLGAP